MSAVISTFGGRIVAEDRGGTIRQYTPDNLGSTIALIDTAGTVTDTYDYWPYGEERVHTGSSATPFTFLGVLGYFKDFLNMLYVRARHLRVDLTQWVTADPLWPLAPSYGYADADPATETDPTGLLPPCGNPPGRPPRCTPSWRRYISSYCQCCRTHNFDPACMKNCNAMISAYKASCGGGWGGHRGGQGGGPGGGGGTVACGAPEIPGCSNMLRHWDDREDPVKRSNFWSADCAICCQWWFDHGLNTQPYGRDWVTDCGWGCLSGEWPGGLDAFKDGLQAWLQGKLGEMIGIGG
jgi:RHS repeat-associated protein